MNQIIYILILFSLLFLIETKAINILLSFVAIIITLAFLLPTITTNFQFIESEYFSYILILVQVSALTILFGFIIMLFPSLSHSNPKTIFSFAKKRPDTGLFIFILIGSIILFTIHYFGVKNIISIFNSFQFLTYNANYLYTQDILNNFNSSDTLFLRKLGLFLYSIDHNIIKLITLTIILLLAIISLFFLI